MRAVQHLYPVRRAGLCCRGLCSAYVLAVFDRFNCGSITKQEGQFRRREAYDMQFGENLLSSQGCLRLHSQWGELYTLPELCSSLLVNVKPIVANPESSVALHCMRAVLYLYAG